MNSLENGGHFVSASMCHLAQICELLMIVAIVTLYLFNIVILIGGLIN